MRNMRRNNRNGNSKDFMQNKIVIYSIVGVSFLIAILVGLLMYSSSLSKDIGENTLDFGDMTNITGNNTLENDRAESASTEIGKSVNEALNETNSITNSISENTTKANTTNIQNQTNKVKEKTNKVEETSTSKETEKQEKKEEAKKELSFERPVEGDILKAYAKDNLVYSETLQEWTTHLGVDIKADKTTVVKASEAGTVKTIKNDPRYGLTITIEHDNGYQTVYANLLSSEFVIEGEKVEKGQSIGTVGNTATFEIADEPHLHFEILKDGVQIDPNTVMK